MPSQRGRTTRPSTVTLIELRSTPEPRSDAETTTAPRVETSRSFGGVVSPIQKRNVNGPTAAAERVSKTMLYTPADGRTAPAICRASPASVAVRIQVQRQPRVAGEAILARPEHDVRNRPARRDGDTEVRRVPVHDEPIDALRPGVGRVTAGRIAVGRDSRVAAGRRAGVGPGAGQRRRLLEPEHRGRNGEPVGDPPHVGAAGEDRRTRCCRRRPALRSPSGSACPAP